MFIISEISPQFGADIETAEQMILQSKLAGANAAKLQLYPAEMYFPNPDRYLKARELSFSEFKRLKAYGDTIGLPVFATAFTLDRLEWCLEVQQKYFKIAARSHVENPELVEKVMTLGKTTFVSVPHYFDTNTLKLARHCIYLHCIAKYPTLLEEVYFPDFGNGIFSGISDHSLGIGAALVAASRGCKYLEKHFTVSKSWQRKNEKGHLGAMTMDDLLLLKRLTRDIETIVSNE